MKRVKKLAKRVVLLLCDRSHHNTDCGYAQWPFRISCWRVQTISRLGYDVVIFTIQHGRRRFFTVLRPTHIRTRTTHVVFSRCLCSLRSFVIWPADDARQTHSKWSGKTTRWDLDINGPRRSQQRPQMCVRQMKKKHETRSPEGLLFSLILLSWEQSSGKQEIRLAC